MTQPKAIPISLFEKLNEALGEQIPIWHCTKATLVHFSHTLEDIVLRNEIPAMLFTGFQESSYWRQETERYRALSQVAQQVCVFAGGTLPPESHANQLHVTLAGDDPLRQEWFLVILSDRFSVLLCGQDGQIETEDEATRQFKTIWTLEPTLIQQVLDLLEQTIAQYRPERLAALQEARQRYKLGPPDLALFGSLTTEMIRFEEELHQRLQRMTQEIHEQMRWRDELLATLVHDMRSPLQGLLSSLDMLKQPSFADEANLREELFGAAERGARQLQEMIQMILDSHQLAENQLPIEWRTFEVAPFLEETLKPLRPNIVSNYQIELEIQHDTRVEQILADAGLLRRVLQNLISNAARFTAAGGTITVGVRYNPNEESVEFRVRDTGIGISPRNLPYIFERFYRADRRDRRSSGIGLYFCRLVAEAHHGSIRADSHVGVGTTITISLPRTPPVRDWR